MGHNSKFANSADPDEEQYGQGLNCLYRMSHANTSYNMELDFSVNVKLL